jgi:hypothetical protein
LDLTGDEHFGGQGLKTKSRQTPRTALDMNSTAGQSCRSAGNGGAAAPPYHQTNHGNLHSPRPTCIQWQGKAAVLPGMAAQQRMRLIRHAWRGAVPQRHMNWRVPTRQTVFLDNIIRYGNS